MSSSNNGRALETEIVALDDKLKDLIDGVRNLPPDDRKRFIEEAIAPQIGQLSVVLNGKIEYSYLTLQIGNADPELLKDIVTALATLVMDRKPVEQNATN